MRAVEGMCGVVSYIAMHEMYKGSVWVLSRRGKS